MAGAARASGGRGIGGATSGFATKVSSLLKNIASVLASSAVMGVSSVLAGALLERARRREGLQEPYAQMDRVLDAVEERIWWLKASYASGAIT